MTGEQPTPTVGAPATPISLWHETLGCDYRQHYVMADTLRTRVLEAGTGDALILLHGTGGHAEAYGRNLRELSHHFRVIAFDLLGHGFSDKPAGPYTLDRYTEQLRCLMDALGLARAHLSGESLGAWVAAWFAAEHPHRVGRLLLNTPGNIANKPEVMAMIRETTRAAVRNPTNESVYKRLSWLFAPANRGLISDELVSIRREIYMQPGYAEAIEGVLALQEPAIRAQFAWKRSWCERIRAPTLILWTTEDPTGTEDEGRLLQDWIPGSRFTVLDGAGHWPQWERPTDYNSLLIDFLRSTDSPGRHRPA